MNTKLFTSQLEKSVNVLSFQIINLNVNYKIQFANIIVFSFYLPLILVATILHTKLNWHSETV